MLTVSRSLRVLVACEFSGIVREAFRRLGHDAVSCDLLETEIPGPHHLGDVRDVLGQGWDLIIAHPPCTYLCASGLHWNKRRPERAAQTTAALEFIRELWAAPCARLALENPIGCIPSRLGLPATQIVQPYDFGDDASKATCLWLRGLPKLTPTQRVPGRLVRLPNGKTVERWGNQLDSGQSNLPPSADRWALRSRTFPGLAEAMAAQWGGRVTRTTFLPAVKPDALSPHRGPTPAPLPPRGSASPVQLNLNLVTL